MCAFYLPPKHVINNHFNPLDFPTKEETENQISISDIMTPPIIDQGVTFIKSDLKLNTNPNFIFDDETSRLGIGTNAPSTTLHVQGNSFLSDNVSIGTVGTSKFNVGGTSSLNGNTDVAGTFKISSNAFSSLTTNGLINVCSKTSEYPVVIQSTDNTNALTKSALAFSASSNSETAPEADISFTRTSNAPARGKLDVNLVTSTTNKENVMSFQGDKVLINKKVGINQSTPLSALHVTGDGIVSGKLSVGVATVPTYRLTFPSTVESKICYYEQSASTIYGVGITSASLNYMVPAANTNHVFRQGGVNGDGTVLAVIKGDGKFVFGSTTAPMGKLTFDDALNAKITLKAADTVNHHGIGISSSNVSGDIREQFNFHVPTTDSEFSFWARGSNGYDSTLAPTVTNDSTGATDNTANKQRHLMKLFYSENNNRPCMYIGRTLPNPVDYYTSFFGGNGQQLYRSYQLMIETDSAAKSGGGSWISYSDERLKENIENANLSMCYDNVKALKLKRFAWKKEVYTDEQISDRNVMGFIAQDVELIFPKAVHKRQAYGLEDCRDLLDNEINRSLYGCVQKLIQITEEQTARIQALEIEIQEVKKLVF